MFDSLLKMLVVLFKQVFIGNDDCVIAEGLYADALDVMDVAILPIKI